MDTDGPIFDGHRHWLHCSDEWYLHDADWHLLNGSMVATPDATAEPPRPTLDVGIVAWHPQYWDFHEWMGEDGTPTVSFANPKATGAGLRLPDQVNYHLVNGRRELVSYPKQSRRTGAGGSREAKREP